MPQRRASNPSRGIGKQIEIFSGPIHQLKREHRRTANDHEPTHPGRAKTGCNIKLRRSQFSHLAPDNQGLPRRPNVATPEEVVPSVGQESVIDKRLDVTWGPFTSTISQNSLVLDGP